MKTKTFVIAIAIFGGLLFTANSTETLSQDEQQSTRIEKKSRPIVADSKIEKKSRPIVAEARIEKKSRPIAA
ncbi:hypothetical protein VOI54_13605 [Tamlana sp. 2201CG12-4]|uniref:hypothetical protein n=1 Tax=Tamlana sp. 2201CG12-4 TaxID=3112582 RepID=UPI002DBFC25A|nr:hypothetical protein [Tamlana sp. 2201CG12-4]MEC3908062.1 hypothetical protein [Tamlana sp. 2201CG12-4]